MMTTAATSRRATGMLRSSAATIALMAVVAGAWAAIVLAQLFGVAPLMHHHALIEDGPPLLIATGLFTISWLVMVAAMMLPSSVPAIATFGAERGGAFGQRRALGGFVGAYLLVWTAFGLACFCGDFALHKIVDATPWLADRPWLVEAAVVAMAGAYQFTPMKRRALDACRHPAETAHTHLGGVENGLRHAADCLGASGALMLLMFAAGFANIWWMLILTGLMVYEALGRHGHRLAFGAGLALLYLAVFALTNQGLPAWPG